MIFVDTGYLVGLIDPGDDLHSRAIAWMRCIREPLVTTDYVTLEATNYFSGSSLRLRSHEILERLSSRPTFHVIHIDIPLRAKGIELHRGRPDKLWSRTDCVSFVVMEQRGIQQALAFDHHFEQAGFEALLRREP